MGNNRHVWVVEYYAYSIKEWYPLQAFKTRRNARDMQKRDFALYTTRIVKYTPEKKEVITWQTMK